MANGDSGRDSWNAMRALILLAGWTFALLFLVLVAGSGYVAWQSYESGSPGFQDQFLIRFASQTLDGFYRVAGPLIQLFVLLVILEWFLKRMGIDSVSAHALKGLEWNTQTIVALIVIGSFSVAALGGITVGLNALKDLALVVVGFYFGTQRKVVEFDPRTGQYKETIDHENTAAEILARGSTSEAQKRESERPPGVASLATGEPAPSSSSGEKGTGAAQA